VYLLVVGDIGDRRPIVDTGAAEVQLDIAGGHTVSVNVPPGATVDEIPVPVIVTVSVTVAAGRIGAAELVMLISAPLIVALPVALPDPVGVGVGDGTGAALAVGAKNPFPCSSPDPAAARDHSRRIRCESPNSCQRYPIRRASSYARSRCARPHSCSSIIRCVASGS
jgi:hypothetical protein